MMFSMKPLTQLEIDILLKKFPSVIPKKGLLARALAKKETLPTKRAA